MDDSLISNPKANSISQNAEVETVKFAKGNFAPNQKAHSAKVIDAQVVETEADEVSLGRDINPGIFDEPYSPSDSQDHSIPLDNFGRSIASSDAERIKDRLNESFTEQFGTAEYSPALKRSYQPSLKGKAAALTPAKPQSQTQLQTQPLASPEQHNAISSQSSVSAASADAAAAPAAGVVAGVSAAATDGAVQAPAVDLSSVDSSVAVQALGSADGQGKGQESAQSNGVESKQSKGKGRSSLAGSTMLPVLASNRQGKHYDLVPAKSPRALTKESQLSDDDKQARDQAHEQIKQIFDSVDVENLAKGLDVLKQVKDINEQRRKGKIDDADELENDYLDNFSDFDEGFDEDEPSLQGMHFVAENDQDDLEDELGFDEQDDLASPVKGLGEKSSSRAIARSAGNIGAFIRAANMVPMLSEQEERDLAKRLREFGDVEAARKLVTSHLRFVVSVARKFTGYGLPLADLIQEGNIGLMKAVKNYDPEVGHGLAAFASNWIKAEMFDYVIRNWRMVKVATTKAQRKLFFNLRKSKKRLGWMSESERSELANDLGVSVSDVTEMEARLAGSDVGFDLDEDDSSDKSVSVTLSPASYLEDENSNFAQNYENSNYAAWEVKKLREALSSLDSRSCHIIKRRWLDENKATLQELSTELKVSIERVRQLENNAMNKVKAILLNEGFKADEQVLALEHHDTSDKSSKGKKVAASRTKASTTKRASGKGASARLKNVPLSASHQLSYKGDESKTAKATKATKSAKATKAKASKAQTSKDQS